MYNRLQFVNKTKTYKFEYIVSINKNQDLFSKIICGDAFDFRLIFTIFRILSILSISNELPGIKISRQKKSEIGKLKIITTKISLNHFWAEL